MKSPSFKFLLPFLCLLLSVTASANSRLFMERKLARVRRGMKMEEVRSLLGPPAKKEVLGPKKWESWFFDPPQTDITSLRVNFDPQQSVHSVLVQFVDEGIEAHLAFPAQESFVLYQPYETLHEGAMSIQWIKQGTEQIFMMKEAGPGQMKLSAYHVRSLPSPEGNLEERPWKELMQRKSHGDIQKSTFVPMPMEDTKLE